MTLRAPHVYIDDVLMENHALADVPVLAGLSFDWGTDSLADFDDAKTLSADLLVRTPSTLDFLYVGAPFGLVDPDTLETFFAGRVATLTARPDTRHEDALLISLTAADTTADISQYRVERIDWVAPTNSAGATGADRLAQLQTVMPAGWTLEGTTPHDSWTSAGSVRWTAPHVLPLIDRHCRSVLGRRHNTSRYVPGWGLIPRLTITAERSKAAALDRLAADAAGEWHMTTPAPANSAALKLTAGHVGTGIEWEKNPDDVVTDVALTTYSLVFEVNDAGQVVTKPDAEPWDLWVNSYLGVDNSAMQAKYGFHQIHFEVDTGGGNQSTNPHISQIVNYWVDADADWRPTLVPIPDSRLLPDATVRAMLATTSRFNAYATIDGLPASNPAGGTRVRAYVIGGSAKWTGKKWVIELTLGRVPRPAAAGGTFTFAGIAAHTTTAIRNGTAETIGPNLSFADFAYIGA